MRGIFSIFYISFLFFLLGGCSGSHGEPVGFIDANDFYKTNGNDNGTRLLWGMWNIHFDLDELTATVEPVRNIQTHFNVTPILQPPTCNDCLAITINSFNDVTRILDLDATLSNPWKISGYDIRGILYTNDPGPELRNPDDCTSLFDIPEGYEINPFRAFAKGETNRLFAGEAEHVENYLIYLPEPPNWPSVLFAVDASWPDNCNEPYSIDNVSQDGTLYHYIGSSVNIQVSVHDWQEDVNGVTLTAPEITGVDNLPFTHISGDLWTIELKNNVGAAPGDYRIRINATSTGSDDLALHDVVNIHVSGGISENYPGDTGIENDPEIIFVEHFQENTLDDLFANWEEAKNPANIMFSNDVPSGSAGNQSFKVRHVGGDGTGAHLYRRLLPGYDQLHIRFYVKFDTNCGPIHHFFHAGGYNPSTPWPQGGAGEKPVGNERFTTGVEPFGNYDPWRWDFYSYWMEMHICPDDNYWGNYFINDPELSAEKGEWICLELMMKVNDPVTERNGEMALWIDGQLQYKDGQCTSWLGEGFPNGGWVWDHFTPDPAGDPFEGFRWRSDEELNINFIWLLVYITKADEGHVSEVWYDQVVVANEYIGPITP